MDEGSAIVAAASEAVIDSPTAASVETESPEVVVDAKTKGKDKTKKPDSEKKRKLKDRQDVAAKKRLRKQDEVTASADAIVAKRATCLEYLSKWNTQHVTQPGDEDSDLVKDVVPWKFSKPLQNWLVKHALDRTEVSKEMFKLATPYLESVRGATRDRLLEDAREVAEADETEFEEQVQRLDKKQGSEKKVRALRARRKRAIILSHVLQE